MLVWSQLYGGGDGFQEQALKQLSSWAEKRDGTITGSFICFFIGFRRGLIFPTFQMSGEQAVLMAALKISVRNSVTTGPRCLSIIGKMMSGPVALEHLDLRVASAVCADDM